MPPRGCRAVGKKNIVSRVSTASLLLAQEKKKKNKKGGKGLKGRNTFKNSSFTFLQ
jgi:hypothetical protein